MNMPGKPDEFSIKYRYSGYGLGVFFLLLKLGAQPPVSGQTWRPHSNFNNEKTLPTVLRLFSDVRFLETP